MSSLVLFSYCLVADRQDGNPDPKGNRFKCGQKHDGTSTDSPNEWLAQEFDKLFNIYDGDPAKNSFSIQGYQKSKLVCRPALTLQPLEYCVALPTRSRVASKLASSKALARTWPTGYVVVAWCRQTYKRGELERSGRVGRGSG